LLTRKFNISDISVAILAGGFALRLRPATEKIPKSVIPVAGRPFILHQLELLKVNGIKHVVLCIGHLGRTIEELVGDGSRLGLEIEYSYDGNRLLGTGGAIKKALPILSDPFFILYGDSYLPTDYSKVLEAYKRSDKLALMTVYENHNQWDKSNIWFEDNQIKAYNKKIFLPQMKHIDYGLSVFSKEVFRNCKSNKTMDLGILFNELWQKNELGVYEVPERFYEIGSLKGLTELDTKLTQKGKV